MAGLVPTLCRMCSGNCGVWADSDYRMLPMKEHPHSAGRLCSKARMSGLVALSPHRILHPHQRTADGWRRITWDEALDLLADRISRYLDHQPEAIAAYLGEAVGHVELRQYARRWCQSIGSPNLATSSSICFQVRAMAAEAELGRLPYPDYRRAETIVVWGANPIATRPPEARALVSALRAGKKLVVIDPRVTPLARRADLFIRPRPGTDGRLAWGLSAEAVRRGAVADEETCGPAGMPPAEAARDAGVSVEEISRLVDLCGSGAVACLLGNGLEHSAGAFENIRAIYAWLSLVGAFGPRGAMHWGSTSGLVDLSGCDQKPSAEPVGHSRHPSYCRSTGEAHALRYIDAIQTGDPYPLRVLVIQGGNPLATWPGTERTRRAFAKLDHLAVMDLFWSETARAADLVLPAAHYLERSGFHFYAELGWLSLRSPAADPPGDCRPDWWLWFALARRLGRPFPWTDNDEAMRDMLPTADWCRLRASPAGAAHGQAPSGAPVPHETLVCDPPLPPAAGRGELMMVTGARLPLHVHSRYFHIPEFERRQPWPGLEMNPADARERGIQDGNVVMVSVGSDRISTRAAVCGKVPVGVVHLCHGWPDYPTNALTGGVGCDPNSGFPALKEVPCVVRIQDLPPCP